MNVYTESMTKVRRRVGAVIGRMSKEDALSAIESIRADGITIFSETIRKITGGFNSQAINSYVIRKLAIKAGIIKAAA